MRVHIRVSVDTKPGGGLVIIVAKIPFSLENTAERSTACRLVLHPALAVIQFGEECWRSSDLLTIL